MSAPTVTSVPEVLRDLADSHPDADELAAYLASLGIRAIPSNPLSCVVAEYVRQRTDVEEVSVWPTEDICEPPTYQVGTDTHILPEVLNELANRFDHRQYPDLIDPDSGVLVIEVA